MAAEVTVQSDLFSFFHDRISQVRTDDGIDLTDDAALYLAQMLSERARHDRSRPRGDTLAELHLLHAHASPTEQVQAYRELGDRALHELAWFQERVERTIVGPDYYQRMGRSAYGRLHDLLDRWFSRAFGSVFEELADRFSDCVKLLRVAQHGCAEGADIEEILLRWEQTRSPHIARLLHRHGVWVTPQATPKAS